jgi:GT2 family glycosyltransferase
MGCGRALFDTIGLFDEREFLRSAEDNDWSYRAMRAGVVIQYDPAVRVTHLDWRDDIQLAKTYRAYARSQGGVYGKFLRRGDWFVALRVLLELVRALRRWLLGVVRRDSDMSVRGWSTLSQLPAGIVAGWRAEGAT